MAKSKLGDMEILEARERGESLVSIGRRAGISRQAVAQRLKMLRDNIPAPAAARASEAVEISLNAFKEVTQNYTTLQEIAAACLREITDQSGQIDLRTNAWEARIRVRNAEGQISVHRASDLLDQIDGAEDVILKRADPRTLLMTTLRLKNQTLELALHLQERLYQIQEVAAFQEDVIHEIEQADPATARRVKDALHRRRTLRLALQPPGGNREP